MSPTRTLGRLQDTHDGSVAPSIIRMTLILSVSSASRAVSGPMECRFSVRDAA